MVLDYSTQRSYRSVNIQQLNTSAQSIAIGAHSFTVMGQAVVQLIEARQLLGRLFQAEASWVLTQPSDASKPVPKTHANR
jgi:hypothetical protein